jgi:hypothetical protein
MPGSALQALRALASDSSENDKVAEVQPAAGLKVGLGAGPGAGTRVGGEDAGKGGEVSGPEEEAEDDDFWN